MTSFKKNIGASFVGNVVYALSQWILFIILAKLGDEKILGVYALALAVVSPIFALTSMNLRAIQATDVEQIVHFSSYRRFRRRSSLFAVLICTGFAIIAYHHKINIAMAIICLSAYKYFEFQSDLVYGFFQRRERMELIAYSVMIRGVGNVFIVGSIYYFTHNLNLALALAIIKSWAIYAFFDKINQSLLQQNDELKYKTLSELLRIAWPLGIVVFSNVLILNIPRYFIAQHYDESAVGIFSSISYFIIAGSTLVNAIGQASVPRLAKIYKKNLLNFKILAIKIFFLILCVGLLGVLIAQYFGICILRLAYTETIATYHQLLVQIMWAGVAIYSSVGLGCIATSLRDFKFQSYLSMINILVIFLASLWLINTYGLSGAAWAITATYLFKLIALFFRLIYTLRCNKEYA